MYHILLSLIAIGAPLDCEHASELIDTAKRNNPDKSELIELEITRVVIAHTDPMCFKDAKLLNLSTEGTGTRITLTG